jgi:hypothetical protein
MVKLLAVINFVGLTRRYRARLQLELWCLAKAAVASRQSQLRVELNHQELCAGYLIIRAPNSTYSLARSEVWSIMIVKTLINYLTVYAVWILFFTSA